MRLKLLLPAALLIAPLPLIAQTYDDEQRFSLGSTQTIFPDTAYIRNAPSGSAAAMDSLYAFETLKIVKRMKESLTLGRKTAAWYQVSFQRNGAARLGYLWGGAMALKAFKHQGVQFAAGMLSYPDAAAMSPEDSAGDLRYKNTFAIKAKSATARDECHFNISRESGYFYEETDSNGVVTDKHVQAAKGLPAGASFIVHFGMSGEACGIPTYDISAAWNGRNLIRMPLIESNADGGQWLYEEAFVYPGQKGGKPGELRVKQTSSESVDENSDKMKTEITWRSYRYDAPARRFILLKQESAFPAGSSRGE
jgi:hypothetical protein